MLSVGNNTASYVASSEIRRNEQLLELLSHFLTYNCPLHESKIILSIETIVTKLKHHSELVQFATSRLRGSPNDHPVKQRAPFPDTTVLTQLETVLLSSESSVFDLVSHCLIKFFLLLTYIS